MRLTLAVSGAGRATADRTCTSQDARARCPLHGVVGGHAASPRCRPHLATPGHDITPFERGSFRLAPADRASSSPTALAPPSPPLRSPLDSHLIEQPSTPLSALPLAQAPVTPPVDHIARVRRERFSPQLQLLPSSSVLAARRGFVCPTLAVSGAGRATTD